MTDDKPKPTNPTGRSVHRNQKTLEAAVEGFIADVEATIASKRDLKRKGQDSAASWITLEAVIAPMYKLQAALDEFRGEARPVPRKPYERTTVKREVHGKEITESHESYGMVGIHRVSGGGVRGHRLFGSAVEHGHFFMLRIMRAKRVVAEFGEQFYSDGRVPIVEIALTAAQFAEMITTLNVGDGVPCTITDVEGVSMDSVPDDAGSELRRFHDDFKEHLTDIVDKLVVAEKTVEEVLAKKSITVADKDVIRRTVHTAVRVLNDHAPFVLKQFSESTEKMIAKGKTEIESFVNLVFQRAGIKAISAAGGIVDAKSLLGDGEKKE